VTHTSLIKALVVPPCLVLLIFLGLAHSGPAVAASCGTENLLAGKMPSQSNEMQGNLAQLTDGNIGPEGAQWNAPVVVTLDTSTAGVTYDLGEPRQLSALFMQGDANDVYKVSGSLDGSPSSFKPLAEFPNVVATGHGLRTRTVEIEPATLRYLRVGEATGDTFFSISELAAYCQKPSPFPPVMRAVDAPAQPGAGDPAGDAGRSFRLLFFASGLAFAWLAYRTIKRARGSASP
jgi:hypothetical protein